VPGVRQPSARAVPRPAPEMTRQDRATPLVFICFVPAVGHFAAAR
jgi:hypothetical protein